MSVFSIHLYAIRFADSTKPVQILNRCNVPKQFTMW